MLPDLKRAIEALRHRDLKTAELSARRAAMLAPQDPEPLVVMAVVQAQAGAPGRALELVDRALMLDKEHPGAQQIRGDLMLAAGQAESAEAAFSTVLKRQPRNVDALRGLAAAYQRQKHFARAIDTLKKYLRANPGDAGALSDLGTALADLGQFEEAAQAYRKSLLANPNLVGARLNLALLDLTPETLGTSATEMERVVKSAPNLWLGLLHLALARRMAGGDPTDLYEQAARVSAEAAAIRDSHDYFLEHRGAARFYGERLRVMQDALAASPDAGLICEFGVYRGTSLNFIAVRTESVVHGFDTFEGLPEKWTEADGVGKYTTKGSLPEVRPNVRLHVGLFAETLPGFLSAHPEPARLLHIDCDLYSSTCQVLDLMADRIVPGTVVIFDEYFGYAGWRDHEWRAFQEWLSRNGRRYEYLAFNAWGKQTALRVL